MTFQIRVKEPKTMLVIGMSCLALAILWPYINHPATNFGRNLAEGIRGLLFGLSLSFNVMSALRGSRQRRWASN